MLYRRPDRPRAGSLFGKSHDARAICWKEALNSLRVRVYKLDAMLRLLAVLRMQQAIVYDITRLVTRMFNVTPNGIDRVDFAFARHFLLNEGAKSGHAKTLGGAAESGPSFGMIVTPWGPRLFPADAARAAVEGIGVHWGEDHEPQSDPAYARVCAYLRGENPSLQELQPRVKQGRSGQFAGLLRWLLEFGTPIGRSPVKSLEFGATYINVSQFPLWIPAYFEWLEMRRDVNCVFFIHDLLPIEMPEYFPKAEYERHCRRLANVARFATGVIVASECVQEALSAHLRGLGRIGLPICVAPVPVAAIFSEAHENDLGLGQHPYFVMCGTIEPRKNHLLLLHVWRELVRRHGKNAPKLVIIGNRGWKYELVIDLMETSALLKQHVIEVSGLTTPAVKKLLDGAQALLMPSFAEGYGLPVREALMANVPVIASDIPAFREIKDQRLNLLSPINGDAWLAAIEALAKKPSNKSEILPANGLDWTNYFNTIDQFIASL
jgi:glycosyltransferase involved in cell wall biosynthesis